MNEYSSRFGGVCWWCYWGWPKPIADIYNKALDALGMDDTPLHYGPAHTVWEDENFDDAQGCLDRFDEWIEKFNEGSYSEQQLSIVKQSLEELVVVDGKYKEEPDGYDGIHPERYPPPEDWVMCRQ